jgi:hypothetical protein
MIQKPVPEVVNAVLGVLEEHKVKLPQDHVEMVIACMAHWMENNKRGHEYMAHLLNLKPHKGQHSQQYFLLDGFGRLTRSLEPENIIFLQGCSYKGEVLDVRLVQVTDRESEYCDGCGAKIICGQDLVLDGGVAVRPCSRCLAGDEDQDTRDMVKLSCEKCTFTECSHNPNAERRVAV